MYLSVPLTAEHELDEFCCGKTVLDDWLTSSALRAQVAGSARTYVWTDGDTEKIWAYFAISPTEVVRSTDGISCQLSGGYSRIPGYLVGRLALHQSLHGRRLGSQLLLDVVSKVVAAAEVGGGRLIVVDAVDDEAHSFYAKFGFMPVRNRPDRLVMKVSTARAALAR